MTTRVGKLKRALQFGKGVIYNYLLTIVADIMILDLTTTVNATVKEK